MNIVLDSSAVIAFLRAEQGGDEVRKLLLDTHHNCAIHAINACEVFYDLVRSEGEQAGETAIRSIQAAGVEILEDMDEDFWRDAGLLKARLRKISLADCIAVSLARREDAALLTADRSELAPVQQDALCKVRFIR